MKISNINHKLQIASGSNLSIKTTTIDLNHTNNAKDHIYNVISKDIKEHTNDLRSSIFRSHRTLIPVISILICDPDNINSQLLKFIINYCNGLPLEARNKLKIFLSTEIEICKNIYKQSIKPDSPIDREILIQFRKFIFENSNIICIKNMLFNHADNQSNMNNTCAMKFVDRDALKLKGCNAFEGAEGAEFDAEDTELYPASEHYVEGVSAGYQFLKEQIAKNQPLDFKLIKEMAVKIYGSTYPDSGVTTLDELLNCDSNYGSKNPYGYLEEIYLPPVKESYNTAHLHQLYSNLKNHAISLFSNVNISKINADSLITKFEDSESIATYYNQIWLEFQEQFTIAESDQMKIIAIIMFGAKFEISHFFQNHNNRMMAIIINVLLENYFNISANFYHVNGLSHITMLTILENLENRLPNYIIGRYNYQHFLQEITDGIYWFLINVEMQQ